MKNWLSKSKFVSSSLALMLLRGGNVLVRTLLLFCVAKLTMPSDFGLVTIALTVAEIGRYLADMGLDTLVTREYAISDKPDDAAGIAKTVAIYRTIAVIVVYLGTIILAGSYFGGGSTGLEICLLVGLTIVSTLAYTYSLSYFQARLRLPEVLFPVVGINIATMGLAILGFWQKIDFYWLLSLLPLSELAMAIYLGWRLQVAIDFWQAKFDAKLLPDLLKRSWPIAVTLITAALYSRLDGIFLVKMLSEAAVGYYGIAFRIIEPFQLATFGFSVSAYSRVSTIVAANDVKQYYGFIKRFFTVLITYAAGVSIAIAILAPFFIQYLLPNYIPAIAIVRVLALALFFRTLTSNITCIIQGHGYFRAITSVCLFNLLLIVPLLFILVPIYGAVGAAIALTAGEAINAVIQATIAYSASRRFAAANRV
jgi:O-antigen/teichoic acid export membrane protein